MPVGDGEEDERARKRARMERQVEEELQAEDDALFDDVFEEELNEGTVLQPEDIERDLIGDVPEGEAAEGD